MPEKRAHKPISGNSTRKRRVATGKSPKEKTSQSSPKNVKPRPKRKVEPKNIKPKKNQTDEVVTLPNAVSAAARLRERMLRIELDEHLQKAMYRIAYGVGLCFILVGSAYSLIPLNVSMQSQSAALLASDTEGTLDDAQSTTTNTTETNTKTDTETIQFESSEFTFLTTIPDTVSAALEVSFEATNALSVIANLVLVGTNGSLSLPTEQISDTTYRTLIKPELFTPGYYKLMVYVKPLDGSGTYVRSTKEFYVGDSETTNNEILLYEPSEFNFLTTIPDNVVENTRVDFQITNAKDIVAKMTLVGVIGFVDMQLKDLSNDTYRTIIEPARFSPGYYQVRVFVKPLDGSKPYSRTSDKFFVGSSEQEDRYNDRLTANQEDTTGTSENETNLQDEGSATQDDEKDTTIALPEPTFEFLPPPQRVLTETAILQVRTPTDTATIELYARQVNSLSARYVSTAFKRGDTWTFSFDSKNLPNGEYEFFARTEFANRNMVTKSLNLSVKNATPSRVLHNDQSPNSETLESERFSETQPKTTESDGVQSINGIDSNINRILESDEINFEELFRRYSLAQQTGDESLIRIAREELVKAREQIYLRMIADQSSRENADSVAMRLQETIDDIKDRVDTFESLRRERTAGDSAVDSDSDGISDYDEINLYGTDPHSADTDGDGISDGVEIMRGLDPLVTDAEAVIRYESPKELIGLTRPDVLEIQEVLPVTEEQTDERLILTTAEIRGRALPNSYVTLFIFSTPTVLTVKTDADGSFVYTFDKELSDGRHDVYVAVTDNSGRIVAHSEPFSFVKEAQAFTPVGAAGSDFISPKGIVETTNENAYRTTLGVAVLAFGLILFVLGVSLRKQKVSLRYEMITGERDGASPAVSDKEVLNNVKFVSPRKEHIDAS